MVLDKDEVRRRAIFLIAREKMSRKCMLVIAAVVAASVLAQVFLMS